MLTAQKLAPLPPRPARSSRPPIVPILALSANVMPHQVEEYLACGMDGLIPKPVDMTAPIKAIDAAVCEVSAAA